MSSATNGSTDSSSTAAGPVPSGRRGGWRLFAAVFIAMGILYYLNLDLRENAAWVFLAGAIWCVIRMLLMIWRAVSFARAAARDPWSDQDPAWKMEGNLSFLSGILLAIFAVLVWWPWTWGHTPAGIAAAAAAFVIVFVIEMFLGGWTRRLGAQLLALRLPYIRECLQSSESAKRAKAARTLFCMGRYAAAALPALIKALGDESAEVRAQAALAIWNSQGDDPELATALRSRLGDADARVRIAAAGILAERSVGTAAEVLPVLREGLMYPEEQFAAIAALSMLRFGSEAAPAIPDLRASIWDRRPANSAALDALDSIGEPAIPVLADVLTHPDPRLRSVAAYFLGLKGKSGATAVPALQSALSDSDDEVRRAAARALGQITGS